jgi:hypothetical protein
MEKDVKMKKPLLDLTPKIACRRGFPARIDLARKPRALLLFNR